tara:strand:+ start:418 stop:621 length:204 start_codon:yes stop_codon:yes gene_type:complete
MKAKGVKVKTVPLKIYLEGKQLDDAVVLQALTGAAGTLLTARALRELFKRAYLIAGAIENGELTDES